MTHRPSSSDRRPAPNLALPDAEDTDEDTLNDAWEIANFGDLETSDGTGDADDDGSTDAQEYAAGTDPNNPDSDDD